jgi:adenylate cyclase class 2
MEEIEYEATFVNVDHDEIRERLEKLGAVRIKDETFFKRVTLNLPSGDKNSWIRVRDEGDKITMSLKSICGEGIECQKEICLEVDNFDSSVSMLEKIGCVKKSYQETKREIWELDGVEIMLDEWPHLEPFVEVEGKNEEDVKRVCELLGFGYDDAIFDSITKLYALKYGVLEDVINNEIPRICFDEENPFEGL